MNATNPSKGSFSNRSWDAMGTVWAGVGKKRKRGLRILPENVGYFVHVTSRTVSQAFLFGEPEKRMFVRMMRKWADFSGLSVITYCLMDNHFHMMLWVPAKISLDHAGVLLRLEEVWPQEKVVAWESFYRKQDAETRKSMDGAVMERMVNLPEFMRVLKQSFTRWFNAKNDRKGTLWDSRYRSVVVEGTPLALMSVAAYIDLNPLRAGMVDDPKSYPLSGYGAAITGDQDARRGLDALVHLTRGHQPQAALRVRRKQIAAKSGHWSDIRPRLAEEHARRAAPKNWGEVQAAYRIWLVNKGGSKPDTAPVRTNLRSRKGLDPVQVLEEYESQGLAPVLDVLQHRVRAFTRGVAVGRPEYLEALMRQYRSCFGPKRKSAARRIKGLENDWMSLRRVDGT